MSWFAVGDAKAQNPVPTILKRMDDHNKALQSLQADVTMVKTDSVLGAAGTDTFFGNVTYKPKTAKQVMRARLNWTKPTEEWIVVNGDTFKSFRPMLKVGYEGRADKASKNNKTGGALAFISMSKEQLKANYDVTYLGQEQIKGGTETWHLQLEPKTAQSYKLAEMWVDANGMPRMVRVTEKNNDTSTILLSNISKNPTISMSVFNFDKELPKGAKIHKI